MRTFAEWSRYYNHLDVTPRLEALDTDPWGLSEEAYEMLKGAFCRWSEPCFHQIPRSGCYKDKVSPNNTGKVLPQKSGI